MHGAFSLKTLLHHQAPQNPALVWKIPWVLAWLFASANTDSSKADLQAVRHMLVAYDGNAQAYNFNQQKATAHTQVAFC